VDLDRPVLSKVRHIVERDARSYYVVSGYEHFHPATFPAHVGVDLAGRPGGLSWWTELRRWRKCAFCGDAAIVSWRRAHLVRGLTVFGAEGPARCRSARISNCRGIATVGRRESGIAANRGPSCGDFAARKGTRVSAQTNNLIPSFVVLQVGARRIALPREGVAELIASPLIYKFPPHHASDRRESSCDEERILPVLDLGPGVSGALLLLHVFPGGRTAHIQLLRKVRDSRARRV